MTTMRKSFPGRDHGTGPTESFLTLQRARQPLPARAGGFIGPAIPRNCGVGGAGERGYDGGADRFAPRYGISVKFDKFTGFSYKLTGFF